MSSSPPPQRKGPDISGAQVAGSALAAVSAAVIASFLGVGGTVLGAALGSIVASVGGALYSHSFRRAGDRLGDTKVLTVVTRPRAVRTAPGPGDVPVIEDADGDGDQPPYAESGQESPDQPAEPVEVAQSGPLPAPGGRIPRWLSWKAAVALTVVAFVLAIAAIEVVELVIGRPISGGSGGTTISKLVKPGSSKPKAPKPTPTPTSTPTPTPTGSPTSTATSTPTTTATQPSPSTTPSGTPTSTGPVGPSGTPTG
jgi:hypothetical protein